MYPKRPLEFYGRFIGEPLPADLPEALTTQECPFLRRRCIKIRKSDPTQTIGACTVGYRGNAVMICPHRFIANNTIFRDAVPLLTEKTPDARLVCVPEIRLPGGSIDYFVVALSSAQRVLDFVGLEIQTLDTTGSGGIWEARQDLLRGIVGERYPYGLNWKMTAKTILVQLHHKASAFETIGKHLVLVIQAEFFNYLRARFNTAPLRPADNKDAIHFHVYAVSTTGQGLGLCLQERHSTTAAGAEQMLKIGNDTVVSAEEIAARIEAKLSQARPIDEA